MKYFLAADKGLLFNNKNRFKRIDLTAINVNLGKEENLEALYTFTSTFKTQEQLKNFLKSQKILSNKYNVEELVIVYFENYDKALDIAYECDVNYFNKDYLKKALYNAISNPKCFKEIIREYSSNKKLEQEINDLKIYLSNNYLDPKILFSLISSFIEKIYLENFLELYKLAIFISKITNSNRNEIIYYKEKKELQFNGSASKQLSNLEEEIIEDNQLRWF